MRNRIVTILAIACLISVTGCTDATWGKLEALGNGATIQCYSGGQLIYEGRATGKIKSEGQSDGYYFRATDGHVIEVNADCVITYDQ